MNKQTRYEKVLSYLRAGNALTSMSAFRLFDITRLSDCIYMLRKRGHDITDIPLQLPSGKRCKQYYLERA